MQKNRILKVVYEQLIHPLLMGIFGIEELLLHGSIHGSSIIGGGSSSSASVVVVASFFELVVGVTSDKRWWWIILDSSEISVKVEIISVTRQYKYNIANKNIKTPTENSTTKENEVPFIQGGVDISTNRRVLWRTREVLKDSMVKALGV